MVEPMMEIPFEMFCEFYEEEDIKNVPRINIENESNEHGQKDFAIYQNDCYDKMDGLYKWWTVIKKQREEEIDTLLNEWALHQIHWLKPCDDNDEMYQYMHTNTRYGNYLFKMLADEEDKFEVEKEENLFTLIKLRNRLWQ